MTRSFNLANVLVFGFVYFFLVDFSNTLVPGDVSFHLLSVRL